VLIDVAWPSPGHFASLVWPAKRESSCVQCFARLGPRDAPSNTPTEARQQRQLQHLAPLLLRRIRLWPESIQSCRRLEPKKRDAQVRAQGLAISLPKHHRKEPSSWPLRWLEGCISRAAAEAHETLGPAAAQAFCLPAPLPTPSSLQSKRQAVELAAYRMATYFTSDFRCGA